MFYYVYDMGRATAQVFGVAATAGRLLFDHPLSMFSYAPGARSFAAIGEMAAQAAHRQRRPGLEIGPIDVDGKATPVRMRTIERRTFARLREITVAASRGRSKILIVNPLSGHFAFLFEDLYRGLLRSHDLYVLDWRDAREVPAAAGSFDLDDQIEYVVDALDRAGPGVHLLGFSQSTIPALAAAAIAAEDRARTQPRSLILMAGPVDVRVNPTPLNRFLADHSATWFAGNLITHVPVYYPGAMRRVYPGFVQLAGYVSVSLEDQVGARLALFEALVRGDGDGAEAHQAFFDRFHTVMDLPADFFLDMATRIFRRAELATGAFRWRGRPVGTDALAGTPLMTIEAADDILSAPGQTHAALDLCGNAPKRSRERLTVPDLGDLGLVHGRRWHAEILPKMERFLSRNG